ncbi:FAD-binding oxidoreductase [Bifidobacterium sp. LC6]|uniref:FAD-binding oxidoreductase n=1 Tax=Bifidobacterium colobi TaxID=2809026 RepID=A0ABS5UTV5_9BIFI|nr:FAD-dependent oxidoreductase [Bifidobacterium colobi]MBT1174226.1 FAD-binding oxidoreductase [Bifidobacterium colobi]
MTSPHYLVIGTGILGSAVVHRLASRGVQVTLLGGDGTDAADALGASATVRTFGWLNDAGVNIPEYSALRTIGKLALAQRQVKDAELGEAPVWYHQSGRLDWEGKDGRQELPAHQDAHRETIREEAARLASQGQDAYVIDSAAIEQYEPALDPNTIVGDALWVPEDAWVDLPGFARELQREAAQAGAQIVHGAVDALLTDENGAVLGARLKDGSEVRADRTIVAAGEATADLAQPVITIPRSSTTGVTVLTAPLDNPPRTILRAPFAGARTDDQGRLVIVADPLEAAVTPEGTVPQEALDATLTHIASFLKGRPTLTVEQVLVGPRPIPGDGLPVVGAVAGTGDTLAIAFTHSGATVGYALGRLLADELLDGLRAQVLAPFRPERFQAEAEW